MTDILVSALFDLNEKITNANQTKTISIIFWIVSNLPFLIIFDILVKLTKIIVYEYDSSLSDILFCIVLYVYVILLVLYATFNND